MEDEDRFRRELQKQLRKGLGELGEASLTRAVYVIRMTGDFVIAYEKQNSPVLYIGRGNCAQRLASHVKNWLHEVEEFSAHVGVEIRVASPRRQRRSDYYKYVEADLLGLFARLHGDLPFFNRRHEDKYRAVVRHPPGVLKEMRRSLIIGSGNKPRWALRPTKAHKAFSTFTKGKNLD